MGDVVRIGKCSICQKMKQIEASACEGCRARCGPNGGHVVDRARRDPEFARKILDGLQSAEARRRFLEIVGPLEPRVPGSKLV